MVQLTEIVDNPNTSPEEINEVVHELRQRKSKGALNLLGRITADGTDTPRPPVVGKSRSVRERRKSGAGTPDMPSAMPAETTSHTEHSREAEAQLEVLRTTFTAQAEILARWGLTEALPLPLREAIMHEWSRIVGDDPDQLGRSRKRLARDLHDLAGMTFAQEEKPDDE